MYTREQWVGLEERWGAPREGTAVAPFREREFDLVTGCIARGRAHDVTLLVRAPHGLRFAVIRKPGYPPGVFRPPSGGVEPGEEFEAGATREAWEETGLEIRLERYLLRVAARFTCEGREAAWVTHVFAAAAVGGELTPRDRKEIAEARWAAPGEIHGVYRPRMLAMGSAGMRYRVDLQDAALAALGLPPPPEALAALAGYEFWLSEGPGGPDCR